MIWIPHRGARISLAAAVALFHLTGTLWACDVGAKHDKEACTIHLRLIGDALREYQKKHKSYPDKLSDLPGQFLSERSWLFCPVAARAGHNSVDTTGETFYKQNDPLTSYSYEFGLTRLRYYPDKTMREWKKRQRDIVGEIVPIVRCNQHGAHWVNLRLDGTVDASDTNWEESKNVGETDLFEKEAGGAIERKDVEIPARDEELADGPSVDLSGRFTSALDRSWDPEIPGNDLRNLTHEAIESDVRFDIRGVIQLPGATHFTDHHPAAASGIPVGRKCSKIHFLHACCRGSEKDDGETIATITLSLGGSTEQSFPIVYGTHLIDWWHEPDGDLSSKVAWVGGNEVVDALGKELHLYMTTIDLGGEELVDSIDFVSEKAGPAPFLVAITTDK